MRIARPLTVAVVMTGVLLTGCTGGSGDPVQPSVPETPTTGPWPLTGLPGYPEDSEAPVVVVKVEDTPAGRPQVGIGSADIVVQEMVEGGLTRLAAMYHSEYPDRVEPVRSMRATDVGVVLPTAGTLVASGGERSTVRAVEGAGVRTVTEDAGDPGFSRDSSRVIPYNLMVDVAQVAAGVPPSRPPGSFLEFGEVPEDAEGERAAGLTLRWPSTRSTFALDPDTALWTRADLPEAADFAFTSVIALTVPVRFDGQTDAAGSPIPTMVTEGTGAGIVATGERVYEIAWTKATPESVWTLSYTPVLAEGEQPEPTAFPVPAGRTWLALIPEEGSSVEIEAPRPSARP